MSSTIRLGRLHGIVVNVHVTFLPVLIGAAWLGWARYGGFQGAAFGALAVLLLFTCVLLHEMAHSFQARVRGIGVQEIVLLPFGGLTNLDLLAIEPEDEIGIALAGPLANLGLGLLFGLIASGAAIADGQNIRMLTWQSLQQPTVLGLTIYLAIANLVLALFNLLPALPLDGGRVLRALLSSRMSVMAATHRAAIAGRSFGAGIAAVGFMILALGVVPYGLALIMVAAALYGGATYEDRVTRRQVLLEAWTVGQVFKPAAQTVSPHDPLHAALDGVSKGLVVPVVVMIGEHARLIGLVTAHELRNMTRADHLSVAHVMRTQFPSVRPSDPLWLAYEKLQQSHLFAVPVVSQDDLCGLISLADIRHALRTHRQLPPH
jgi:Zn-dependent protease